MKKFIWQLTNVMILRWFSYCHYLFSKLVSAELMMAHGLKKIGIGVAQAEQFPTLSVFLKL